MTHLRTFIMMTKVTALLGVIALSAPAYADDVVTLNPHVILAKEVLTVGDLFSGAGPHADHILAPAPKPGSELVLKQTDLQRVTDAFRLTWDNGDPSVTATIERDAVLVTPMMLSEALGKSDLADKIASDADILVDSPVDGIALNGQGLPDMAFDALSYDPLTQRFSGIAKLSRDGKVVSRTPISGMAAKMLDVPMLSGPIDRGMQIGSTDVISVRMPARDVKPGMVTHTEDLVGMVARRALKNNAPIAKNDVIPQILVRRNEIVSVTYKNGTIVLTTKARALANAAKGDTVQLENPSSKKIIEAVVTGPQQTTVTMDTTVSISG